MCVYVRAPGSLWFVVVVAFYVFTVASQAVFLHPTEREREREFVIPLAFSMPLSPPYPISASFLPSLTHPLFLSLLFLLSCFCFCLSLHLFLPPSFLACCPGCYQECRNTDVMSRGWKNRQIRFLFVVFTSSHLFAYAWMNCGMLFFCRKEI